MVFLFHLGLESLSLALRLQILALLLMIFEKLRLFAIFFQVFGRRQDFIYVTIESNDAQITLIGFINCQLIIIYQATLLAARIGQDLTLILQFSNWSFLFAFVIFIHFGGIPLALQGFSFIFGSAYFQRFDPAIIGDFFFVLFIFLDAFFAELVVDALRERSVIFFQLIVR